MMEGIKEESVGSLFNLQVQRQDSPIVEEVAPGAALAGGAVPGSAVSGGAVAGATAVGSTGAALGNGSAKTGPALAGPATGGGRPAERGRSGQSGSSSRPGRHSRTGSQARSGAQPGPGGEPRPGAQAPGLQAAPDDPAVPAGLAARGLDRPQRRGRLQYTAPSDDGSGQAQQRSASPSGGADYAKVGRNAPCPCGSGRKYKLCHGDPRNR
jgi:preprotein translocase subunit SecA